MLTGIQPGDCVWDVGANIGLYSELFAVAVGPAGKVISFEPASACVAILEGRLRESATDASWQIVPVALSDNDGDAWLSVRAGDTAARNHLASCEDVSTVAVKAVRAESLLALGYQAPAVVKIDVEGFEGEVLDGMGSLLDRPTLRMVCVEVHFGILNRRGKPNEPSRIVRLLEDHTFAVKWADKSHVVGQR
jgi:FkbM family methyltransferase